MVVGEENLVGATVTVKPRGGDGSWSGGEGRRGTAVEDNFEFLVRVQTTW